MDLALDALLMLVGPLIFGVIVRYVIVGANRKRGILWWLAAVGVGLVVVPIMLMGLAFAGPLGALAAVCELGALIFGPLLIISLPNRLADRATSMFTGGEQEPEATPFYYTAEARRREGSYEEAIELIGSQLVKFPDDFKGLMLLAAIHAEDLQDLEAAQTTVNRILAVRKQTPENVAEALNQLAKWHLVNGADRYGAYEAWGQIIARLPGTTHAKEAAEQIQLHKST